MRPPRPNCSKYFPQDFITIGPLDNSGGWWSAEYQTTDGKKLYYPQDFRWQECPVAALTRERDDGFDPIGIVQMINEARAVGGRAAVFALAKRDARLYDAAAVVDQCRAAESAERMKVEFAK